MQVKPNGLLSNLTNEFRVNQGSQTWGHFLVEMRQKLWTAPDGVDQYISKERESDRFRSPFFEKYGLDIVKSIKLNEEDVEKCRENVDITEFDIESLEIYWRSTDKSKYLKNQASFFIKEVENGCNPSSFNFSSKKLLRSEIHDFYNTFINELFYDSSVFSVCLGKKFKPCASIEEVHFFYKLMLEKFQVRRNFLLAMHPENANFLVLRKDKWFKQAKDISEEYKSAISCEENGLNEIYANVCKKLKDGNEAYCGRLYGLLFDYPSKDTNIIIEEKITCGNKEGIAGYIKECIKFINTPPEGIKINTPPGKTIRPVVLVNDLFWSCDLGRAKNFIEKSIEASIEVALSTKNCGLNGSSYESDVMEHCISSIFDLDGDNMHPTAVDD